MRHTVSRIDDAIRYIQGQKQVYESARVSNARHVYNLWKDAAIHAGPIPPCRKTLKDPSILPAVRCNTLRLIEGIPKVPEPLLLVEARERSKAEPRGKPARRR